MNRSVISIILGFLFAAGALWFVYNLRATPSQATVMQPKADPTVSVYVAKTDIVFGDRIIPDHLDTVDWPERAVPADAILSKEELLADESGERRIAVRSFVAGEPFLKSKVSGYGERPTLARKVADGMRAVSIRIDDVNGVAGFLLPGDRVDVMLTREYGGRDNKIVDIILQNVTVLGIDQLASDQAEDPMLAKTATMEVTTEDAQKLTLAQQVGTLSLALRNFANTEESTVRRIGMGDLGDKKLVRNEGVYVRVRKGSDVSSERVPQ